MKIKHYMVMGVLIAGITGGCADMTGAPQPSSSRAPKDGEIPFPTGYQIRRVLRKAGMRAPSSGEGYSSCSSSMIA